MSELKGDINAIQQFHPFNINGYDEADPYPFMTSEQHQNMLEIMEVLRPKLKAEFAGQIIICGTGDDLNNQNFKDLFYASMERNDIRSGSEHARYWMPECNIQSGQVEK